VREVLKLLIKYDHGNVHTDPNSKITAYIILSISLVWKYERRHQTRKFLLYLEKFSSKIVDSTERVLGDISRAKRDGSILKFASTYSEDLQFQKTERLE